jgi:hypothetical protein
VEPSTIVYFSKDVFDTQRSSNNPTVGRYLSVHVLRWQHPDGGPQPVAQRHLGANLHLAVHEVERLHGPEPEQEKNQMKQNLSPKSFHNHPFPFTTFKK